MATELNDNLFDSNNQFASKKQGLILIMKMQSIYSELSF